MNSGQTIFSQLMEFLPTYEFRQCVNRCNGNYKVKSFSCWDQFLSMAFAQLTYRESLRDIQACLRAAQNKLYHMGFYSKKDYPEKLRRIRLLDPETGKRLIFLTNNFKLPAKTITDLYQCRWQVELFFKWIKQHLRIKAFYGTSENAVKTDIWIAISVYVLIAIVKKQMKLDLSLYTILQILSVSLFEKVPLYQALSDQNYKQLMSPDNNQLNLFQ